jgi:acyl-CoA reductase-like NAD-dependent aldehyde dehydrogenase
MAELEPVETSSPEAVRALVEATLAGAPRLRARTPGERCAALAAAAAMLADPSSPSGSCALRVLPASTGLSREMVAWALGASLRDASRPELLERLAAPSPPVAGARPVPARLAALVLAGNVFTAALRPIAGALALGVPLVCKASSHDGAFPRLLRQALLAVAPDVGGALGVCSFPGGSASLEEALFEQADAIVVYGSDGTVSAIRARARPTARLVEHGHGVSAAYVGASALGSEEQAEAVAERLAIDTAAYDQRGCLSPQVALVERGAPIGAAELAERVHRALGRLGEALPRGPLPAEVAAEQMQWRGTMAVLGELREGAAHAVAHVEGGALRFGPGYRNLLLATCDGPEDAARELGPLGAHLKALGVAGAPDEADRLARALPPPLCPRLCRLGTMQAPPIDALEDGAPAMEGMVRWRVVEG